jgi:hypothetical protein
MPTTAHTTAVARTSRTSTSQPEFKSTQSTKRLLISKNKLMDTLVTSMESTMNATMATLQSNTRKHGTPWLFRRLLTLQLFQTGKMMISIWTKSSIKTPSGQNMVSLTTPINSTFTLCEIHAPERDNRLFDASSSV